MSSFVTKIVRRVVPACVVLALAAGAGFAADAPLDRTRPPTLGPLKPLSVPVVQTQTLPNGLQLAVVEMHEVPVVDCLLMVRAGAAYDPQGSPGLASFVAGMLDEGAGKRSALEISEEADYLGAQFGTAAGMDHAEIGLHVPRARLTVALDLMADVALRPTFPDSEIVRQRKLPQEQHPPVARPAHCHGAAGVPRHPLRCGASVRAPAGWDGRLDRGAGPRPGHALLRDPLPSRQTPPSLCVGDVTMESEAPQARLRQALSADWARRRGAPRGRSGGGPGARAARTCYLVDKPGAPQSVILIGNLGVPRSTPDYYALRVMNNLLGVSFTSRLMQNLRELHGYTYGARSTFDMYEQAGPFRASSSVHTAKTDSAMIEFFQGSCAGCARAGTRGGAGEIEGLHRARSAGRVRDHAGRGGQVPRPALLRPAAGLVQFVHRADPGRDRRGRAAGGAAVHHPGPVHDRGGGR